MKIFYITDDKQNFDNDNNDLKKYPYIMIDVRNDELNITYFQSEFNMIEITDDCDVYSISEQEIEADLALHNLQKYSEIIINTINNIIGGE